MIIPDAYIKEDIRFFDFEKIQKSSDQFLTIEDFLPYCVELRVTPKINSEISQWIIENLFDVWGIVMPDFRSLDNPRGYLSQNQWENVEHRHEYFFIDGQDAVLFRLRWG